MGGSTSTKAESQAYVDGLIKENHVMMFSKTYCPYCKMAKKALDEVGAKYTVVELENRNDGSQIQDILKEKTGASSVPRVFIGGKCIGGGTETQNLLKQGKLRDLCQQ